MRLCPGAFVNPKTGKPYASFFDSWDTGRNGRLG